MRNVQSPVVPFKSTKRESSLEDMLDYLNVLVRKANGNASATARASVQLVFDKIVERLG